MRVSWRVLDSCRALQRGHLPLKAPTLRYGRLSGGQSVEYLQIKAKVTLVKSTFILAWAWRLQQKAYITNCRHGVNPDPRQWWSNERHHLAASWKVMDPGLLELDPQMGLRVRLSHQHSFDVLQAALNDLKLVLSAHKTRFMLFSRARGNNKIKTFIFPLYKDPLLRELQNINTLVYRQMTNSHSNFRQIILSTNYNKKKVF